MGARLARDEVDAVSQTEVSASRASFAPTGKFPCHKELRQP
ncbi:hypothetical protein AK973_1845 [Pseudomonas brassicacearum]|nr:hypothetical protein AK973_1845 [Pseudomonas brassicacearum]